MRYGMIEQRGIYTGYSVCEGEEISCDVTQYTGIHHRLSSLFPYVFKNTDGVVCMPPELRDVFATFGLQRIVSDLATRDAISDLIFATVALCGASSVPDLYSCYLSQVGETRYEEQEFDEIVSGVCKSEKFAGRLELDGVAYVVNPRLKSYSIRPLSQGDHWPDYFNHENASHTLALTSYFDEHVPSNLYGKESMEFADREVDETIEMLMFYGLSLLQVIDKFTAEGWYLAEGTNRAPRLTMLLADLCHTPPGWDLNGWSEEEFAFRNGLSALVSESRPAEREAA